MSEITNLPPEAPVPTAVQGTGFARLSSSLRSRTAEECLPLAASLAMSRGVSRVVDTTRLDKIGIPVFASIRPDALKGSICVHAGKGFTSAEAKIGAYMEAIEYSFAPAGRSDVKWHLAHPIDILRSFQGGIQFTDFAPMMGVSIDAEDSMAVVKGQEIMSNLGEVIVPAQLVFHPFFENPGVNLYGTSTNGLASGSTLEEATVHGLAEVMERHVTSFDTVIDGSVLVILDDAPAKVTSMMRQVEAAGLKCYLRYTKNDFGMAYFAATVVEPDEQAPIPVCGGFGFHPIKEIAAIRAIAEAVQSRLSFIHGGREDLIKRYELAQEVGREAELTHVRQLFDSVSNGTDAVTFGEIPTFEQQIRTLEDARECMFLGLRQAGMHHVVRVTFTTEDYPFQVVKIIVPGAEAYEPIAQRVGTRILNRFQNA